MKPRNVLYLKCICIFYCGWLVAYVSVAQTAKLEHDFWHYFLISIILLMPVNGIAAAYRRK